MNEETMKAMDALAGGGAPAGNSGGGDTTDWKAKYEEAQKALASAKVDQGRVKKLDEEKKALEAKIAELSASRRSEAALSALPDDIREDMPENFAKGSALVAQRMVDEALASRDAELRELKAKMAEGAERNAAIARQQFGNRIEQEFPGFLKSAVMDGGDKHPAWVQYQRYNAPSINAAVNACDFDTLAWHIRKFYSDELGIAPPSGGTGAAAPDPSATGGGTSVLVKPGKTYTWDEIDNLYDEIEVLRSKGDKDGMKRLSDEIEKAQREGRVK